MKKIILVIIAILIVFAAFSQSPVIVSKPQNFITYIYIGDSVRCPNYFIGTGDTAASKAYVRSVVGSGGGGNTIYSGDGIIATNRYINAQDNDLEFDSTGDYTVNSLSSQTYAAPNILYIVGHDGSDDTWEVNNNGTADFSIDTSLLQFHLNDTTKQFALTTAGFGIGTSVPDSELTVIGGLDFKNGTQGLGKVLTSDANGGASWESALGFYPFLNASQIYGTSIPFGYLLANPLDAYPYQFARYCGVNVTNLSQSATGARFAYNKMANNFYGTVPVPILSDAYFNNIRSLAWLRTRAKYAIAATRAAAVRLWANNIQFIFGGNTGQLNSNVTFSNPTGWEHPAALGTLVDYGATSQWFRGNVANQDSANMAVKNVVTPGETMIINNVPGTAIAIQTWGTDSTSHIFSRFTYAVDGITYGTYNPNGIAYDGFLDGGITDGIINDAIVVPGLSDTFHTVTLTFLDADTAVIDCIDGLITPWTSRASPFYVMNGYHMSNGAGIGYNTDGFVCTQSGIDSATNYIDSALSQSLPGYNFAFINTNKYYDPIDSSYEVDSITGIHPTSYGHTLIFNALKDIVNRYTFPIVQTLQSVIANNPIATNTPTFNNAIFKTAIGIGTGFTPLTDLLTINCNGNAITYTGISPIASWDSSGSAQRVANEMIAISNGNAVTVSKTGDFIIRSTSGAGAARHNVGVAALAGSVYISTRNANNDSIRLVVNPYGNVSIAQSADSTKHISAGLILNDTKRGVLLPRLTKTQLNTLNPLGETALIAVDTIDVSKMLIRINNGLGYWARIQPWDSAAPMNNQIGVYNSTTGRLTASTLSSSSPNITVSFSGNSITLSNTINILGSTQTTLVTGTKALSIAGVTTGSHAFVTLVSASGTSLTTQYEAVCTSGTVTIQANVAAGTINIADGSTINVFVTN